MLGFLLAAMASAPPAPSPQQYYAQALAVMQRLPAPPSLAFQTSVRARGMGLADPCRDGKVQWDLGFGREMRYKLTWQTLYDTAAVRETIVTPAGQTCSGRAGPFDRPLWSDVYDWIRYGLLNDAPASTPRPAPVPAAPGNLKTIADISVIAPGAYRVTDGGAQRCPSGTPGHLLHFAARFEAVKHPLRDAVIEVKTLRICMIRFDLGTYQAAGTGFRGDMRVDFGDAGGNWIVTDGHAAMALRAAGLSLKNVDYDFSYAGMTFPAVTAPTPAARTCPARCENDRGTSSRSD